MNANNILKGHQQHGKCIAEWNIFDYNKINVEQINWNFFLQCNCQLNGWHLAQVSRGDFVRKKEFSLVNDRFTIQSTYTEFDIQSIRFQVWLQINIFAYIRVHRCSSTLHSICGWYLYKPVCSSLNTFSSYVCIVEIVVVVVLYTYIKEFFFLIRFLHVTDI